MLVPWMLENRMHTSPDLNMKIKAYMRKHYLFEPALKYEQVDLLPDGTPDYEAIAAKAAGCKVAYIQRSRGYSLRPSFTVEVKGHDGEYKLKDIKAYYIS